MKKIIKRVLYGFPGWSIILIIISFVNLSAQVWGPVEICSHSETKKYSVTITSNNGTNTDGVITAWVDSRAGNSSGPDLYIQKVNPSGYVWRTNGVLVDSGLGNVPSLGVYPQMISNQLGGCIIVYSRNVGGIDYVFCSMLNSNGDLVWGPMKVSNTYPGLAARIIYSSGEAIIAWQVGSSAIAVQMIGLNGTRFWNEGVIVYQTTPPKTVYLPTLVKDETGGAILCWLDSRSEGLGWSLFSQRIGSDGTLRWNRDGVKIFANSGEKDVKDPPVPTFWNHNIIRTSDGAIATAVRKTGNEIFVTKVLLNGAVPWGANGVNISNQPTSHEINPLIISDGEDGACIFWEDYRNGSAADIYANRIDNQDPPSKLWGTEGMRISGNIPGQYYSALAGQLQPDGISSRPGTIFIPWLTNGTLYFQPRGIAKGNIPLYFQKAATLTNEADYDFSASPIKGLHGDPLCVLVYQTSDKIYARAIQTGWPQNQLPESERVLHGITAFPNPFNPGTKITYSIPHNAIVSIEAVDIIGREVSSPVENEFRKAGTHSFWFDGSFLTSGFYFLRFRYDETSTLHKIILLK